MDMSNAFSQYTPSVVRFTIKCNQQRRLREIVDSIKTALDAAQQRSTSVSFDMLPAPVIAPIVVSLREMGFGVTGIDECESRVNYFDVALNVKALVIVVPEAPKSEDHDRGSTSPPVSAEPAHAVCSENEAAAVLQALLPHIEAGAFCAEMPRPWHVERHDDWMGIGTPHVWTLIADDECFAHLPHTVDGPALVAYVNAIGSVGVGAASPAAEDGTAAEDETPAADETAPASSNDALEVCRLLIALNEDGGHCTAEDETRILTKAYAAIKAADA